jgi:succinate-semialdehyde dehydrogenase/glutarate-semialdehyde dehydrogenase
MQLADPSILRDRCLVDGAWVGAADGRTVEVTDPATGKRIAAVPSMGTADTRAAVEAAHRAFPAWAAKTGKERAAVLRRWYELMMAHQDDLGRIMTAEQGKPLAEAKGEVAFGAAFVEWFAEEAKRTYGDLIPTTLPGKRIMVQKEPVGVCAAITPWNFPLAMITRKAGPALAAGCTMVVKPASATPLTALAAAELAQRAGVPPGVLNVVTGSAGTVGGELTSNPLVRKVTFTGSTEVGKDLLRACAGTVKKVSMELGGNAPFIVFDDADLDAAVAGAVASKFRNGGQTCVCANRIFAQARIYEAFTAKLAAAVSALRVGPGLEPGVEIGPLIDEAAAAKMERHVADAVENGARLVVGGSRHALGGTFFEPTVLADVTSGMRVAREETFGPIAPVLRFETEEEAIARANDTEYGLAAYAFTRDNARVWRVSERLQYGIVAINTRVFSTEAAPFGGFKESGMGREGSKYGIQDFLEIKYVCIGGVDG